MNRSFRQRHHDAQGGETATDAVSAGEGPIAGTGSPVRSAEVPSPDAAYPQELECDLAGFEERPLRIRPVRADDAERLVAFHTRLSPGSIYRRYFAARPLLTPQEVSHLTQVDYLDRLALVIEDGTEIVAIGRYERIPSTTTGEVAFVVRDDYQHQGLGHILLDHLAPAAWSRGLTRFSAVTLLENRGMIAIFEHSGFPVTASHRDEEYYVSFSIDPAQRQETTSLRRSSGEQ